MEKLGIHPKVELETIRDTIPKGTKHRDRKAEGQIQRTIHLMIKMHPTLLPDAVERTRTKLARWKHPTFRKDKEARKVLSNLQEVKRICNPRVSSAVFKTVWNGWATLRRFQHSPWLGGTCTRVRRTGTIQYRTLLPVPKGEGGNMPAG